VHTAEFVRKHLHSSHSLDLVDVIFEQPYCRISDLVHRGIAQRQASSRYLQQLVTLGVLHEMTVGKEKLFINPK
jgi:Fic family protein